MSACLALSLALPPANAAVVALDAVVSRPAVGAPAPVLAPSFAAPSLVSSFVPSFGAPALAPAATPALLAPNPAAALPVAAAALAPTAVAPAAEAVPSAAAPAPSLAVQTARSGPLPSDAGPDQGRLLFDGQAERRFWAPAAAVAAVLPVSSAFHELGHYLAARASGRRATIKINKVLIADHDSLPYPKQLAISVAGPAFNFVLAAATAAAAFWTQGAWPWILGVYAATNLWLGATNLVPTMPALLNAFNHESGVSDGAHARDELRAWAAARRRKTPSFESIAADDRRGQTKAEDGPDLESRLEGLAASPDDRGFVVDAVRRADALSAEYASVPSDRLPASFRALRRMSAGAERDARALALAREACARALGKRPYAEQLMAAAAMRRGLVVDQKTGEGKTLSIALAAAAAALDGPVDVHTFNPYLAVRDAAEVGRPLALLGLSVGALDARDEAYLFSDRTDAPRHSSETDLVRLSRRELFDRADVVYGHTNAFVFAELFDQDASSRAEQTRSRRAKAFAIVDEVDAAMMEEATSDFRIVSKSDDPLNYQFLFEMTRDWKPDEDFTLDANKGTVELTDRSRAFLAALRGADPALPSLDLLALYAANALKARRLLRLDHDYAVVHDKVVILDPHTGRLLHGRYWEDGLTRFVEAKEGLQIGDDYRLSSHMSLDAYFRLYARVAGVSGTLEGTGAEFLAAYGLRSAVVPPHRPSVRIDRPDLLYRTGEAKLAALISAAVAARRAGRAVLVGARDVSESAEIARRLQAAGEPFGLLNGLQENEKSVVDAAGRAGALTVATQLAGRGTDIKLDAAAKASGGLLVLLTTMSESPRVDLQYRGRAGRQGEPGETRLYLSLEDEVLRRRADPADLAALDRSFSERGDEAPADAAALLRAIQDRAESSASAERDDRRGRDAVLAAVRARYFARRALWRALPLPFKRPILEALQAGWSDFLDAHENDWRSATPPTAESTATRYRTIALRRAGRALRPDRWAAASGRAVLSSVADFFSGTPYAKLPSRLRGRVLVPIAAFALSRGARIPLALRARAAAAVLLRAALALRPDDYASRHRLATALYEKGDYAGAGDHFQEIISRFWGLKRELTANERSVVSASIENLSLSLAQRARTAAPAERARLLNTAFELNPTDERKRAADAALVGLSEAESRAAADVPSYMGLVYLDKARSAVDAGQYKNATIYFTRVLQVWPTAATAFVGRAYAEKRLGDEAGAGRDLHEALRLQVLDSREFRYMRLLYSQRVGSSLDAARVEAAFAEARDEGAALPPAASESARRAARSEWARGRALLEADDARSARFALDRALKLDPRLGGAYDDRAVARSRTGDLRGAYEDFADALLWRIIGGDGSWSNLIAGHSTRANWTPAPGQLAALIARLKAL